MRGDVILVEKYHLEAAEKIVKNIISEIKDQTRRYAISIAGESGSGKSEMAKAIQQVLDKQGITANILAQDDYFVLPPHSNDQRRREDPQWLGPHQEVMLDRLEGNIIDILKGKNEVTKPLIDYQNNEILEEKLNCEGIEVVIVEGTYTSLLRNIDKRIFIARNYQDTLTHRSKRNRGNEVGDPFIEKILETEHKIIAGHEHLANIIITKDYSVIFTEMVTK
jgi:uridine kinase